MATKFYLVSGTVIKGKSEKPPKGGFDLERYMAWQLAKLNVPFNDDCCTDQTILPVAWVDGGLKRYDPDTDAWVSTA